MRDEYLIDQDLHVMLLEVLTKVKPNDETHGKQCDAAVEQLKNLTPVKK
jgi:hypothetical protein